MTVKKSTGSLLGNTGALLGKAGTSIKKGFGKATGLGKVPPKVAAPVRGPGPVRVGAACSS